MSKMGKAHSLFGAVAPVGQSLSRAFKDRDQQREVISPWRRWYKTARWQDLRYRVLSRDLCAKLRRVRCVPGLWGRTARRANMS